MPRGSIGRRVARAAATGGSRSHRGRAPFGWYVSLILICVVGLSLIGFSRYEANHPTTTTTSTTSTIGPSLTAQWYAGLAFDVCGNVTTLPPSTNSKVAGINSLGSGIVSIAPGSVPAAQAFAGNNATLAQFVHYYLPAMKLTATELQLPGKNSVLHRNGQLCGSTAGTVQIKVWKTVVAPTGQLVGTDPGKVKFANGQMIVVAFVPKNATIPPPPKGTQSELTLLFEESQSTSTSIAPTTIATATTSTGGSTTTSTGGSTTTTAQGKSTTSTTAPSGSTTTSTAAGSTTTSTTTPKP